MAMFLMYWATVSPAYSMLEEYISGAVLSMSAPLRASIPVWDR